MTNRSFRTKREYEDLDEISNANRECETSQQGDFLHFRHHFRNQYASDTAIHTIHLTPDRRSKKLAEQLSASSSATGSIPCFFRLGSNLPAILVEEDKTNLTEKSTEIAQLSYKKNLWLICYVLFYGFYLAAGAFCFQLIETTEKQNIETNFSELRKDFIMKYQISENDLELFLKAAISVTNCGLTTSSNSTNQWEWSFGDLLLFTTSMVTTIGYGHVSPLTSMGKIFCIIYAGIGIPLTLVLLSTFTERLLTHTNKLLKILISKFGHSYPIIRIQLMHLSILALVFLLFFLIVPAFIFAYLEPSWNGLDGFYFCFTSLTTIGLGDLIPDKSDNLGSLYKILTVMYLIIGIIAIMVVLTVFYTIPQLNLGTYLIENNCSEADEVQHPQSLEPNKFQMENTNGSTKTAKSNA